MSSPIPKLDAAAANALLQRAFSGAGEGDIHAEAEVLRLGQRDAVRDVRLWTIASGTFAWRACWQPAVTWRRCSTA